MTNTTTDGYSVTTIEQNGSLAGLEMGRVFVLREHGYNWYGLASIERSREIVQEAATLTREQVEQKLDEVITGGE